MRLLLDENLPKKLKTDFPEQEIVTVREKGWQSFTNGKLLELMLANDFQGLLSFDKNLQHQQNFLKYPIAVIVLNAPINSYDQLKLMIPKIRKVLETKPLVFGPIVISS